MKKLKWLVLAVVLVFGVSAFASCESTKTQEDSFTVTYYDGKVALKTENVKSGEKAVEWTPAKEGQTFVDWFATPTKSIRYNFTSAVTKDISIFAGFSVYKEDTRNWAIVGSGKGDLLIASNWGKVIMDQHKLTKTKDKNEYKITIDLYKDDEFQFVINTDWHDKRGYGYLETNKDGSGAEIFTGTGGLGETAAKGQNTKVVLSGNYTFTLHTFPDDDYYNTSDANYSEANKELYNINPYDTISWIRNGDAAKLESVQTEYYIKGAQITQWGDLYNDYTKMSKLLNEYTLKVYLKAGDEVMFTSLLVTDGVSTTGSEYIRYSNLDDESKALFEGTSNMKAKADGEYTFKYDSSKKLLSVNLDSTVKMLQADYYIDGNFGNHKWNDTFYNSNYKFTEQGKDVYILKNIDLDAGKEFVIQSFSKGATADSGSKLAKYDFNYYRGDVSFEASNKASSNYNFKVINAGKYDISFNEYSKIITLTKSGLEDTVHIKGSFAASWNIIDPITNLPSDNYKLTLNSEGLYEITMIITADMVAGDATWQAGLIINTTTGNDGTFIGADKLGSEAANNVNKLFKPETGNNLTCKTAGTYKITFDLENETINIYQVNA